MPLIEILPSSTSTSAPGWAYVPDTGPDPSKLAIQPSGARKRLAARASQLGGTSSESTTRQTNAVLKHLAELDRESGGPGREKEVPVGGRGGRVTKSKTTPAVRRVLTSQKTFANHLADEEAALAAPPPPSSSSSSSSSAPTPRPPAPKSTKRSAPPAPTAPPPASTAPAPPPPAQPVPTADDANTPLLRSYVPVAPAAAVMEALVAAAPLSYNAARARAAGGPPRRFCEICGFWGRVRCLKCGARVCGVECMGVHGEGRCLKFYA